MCKRRFLKVFGPNVTELGSLVQLKLGMYYVCTTRSRYVQGSLFSWVQRCHKQTFTDVDYR